MKVFPGVTGAPNHELPDSVHNRKQPNSAGSLYGSGKTDFCNVSNRRYANTVWPPRSSEPQDVRNIHSPDPVSPNNRKPLVYGPYFRVLFYAKILQLLK